MHDDAREQTRELAVEVRMRQIGVRDQVAAVLRRAGVRGVYQLGDPLTSKEVLSRKTRDVTGFSIRFRNVWVSKLGVAYSSRVMSLVLSKLAASP